jgi:hypothetical protein
MKVPVSRDILPSYWDMQFGLMKPIMGFYKNNKCFVHNFKASAHYKKKTSIIISKTISNFYSFLWYVFELISHVFKSKLHESILV